MIDNETWTAIGTESFLGLPIIIWVVAVLFVINQIVLSKTSFGRRAYLTGGNREAAVYSGIKVDRLKILIFMPSSTSGGASIIKLRVAIDLSRISVRIQVVIRKWSFEAATL